MKFFLDTADVKAIQKWAETGLVDGVTTNPTHLSKEGGDPKKKIKEIISVLPKGDISVEVTEQKPEAVYKQALAIAKISKNISVKIPCSFDYYPVIGKLAKEGISVNVTLVFTVIQAAMMARLGVHYVSPFIGRLEDIDVDGIQLLPEMREVFDLYGFKTKILAASLRSVPHVHDAMLAGADVLTLPISLFEKMVQNPLTDRGIEMFNADWKKLGVKQFP
jgi:transaldolase